MRTLLTLPILIVKAFYYRIKAGKNIPAKKIENFGRKLGLKKKSLTLFLHPIQSVRYLEFDFCFRYFANKTPNNILDISSPFLFSLYMNNIKRTNYFYINPDRNDLTQIKKITNGFKSTSLFNIIEADASKLPFEDNKFDMIISISVIEHIDDSVEPIALKEIWRVLNKGGTLLLTFPSSKKYFEEYRDTNVYGLKVKTEKQKYFFQRFYDTDALQERILNYFSNYRILAKEIYGEIHPNFFFEYEKRWLAKGLMETVKDPYYIMKEFRKIYSLDELTGNVAITCLALVKN